MNKNEPALLTDEAIQLYKNLFCFIHHAIREKRRVSKKQWQEYWKNSELKKEKKIFDLWEEAKREEAKAFKKWKETE